MFNILVIDTGTSSQRGTLYDKSGKVIFTSQTNYSPNYLEDGRVEQSPDTWRKSLINILKELLEVSNYNGVKVNALSITSARSSVIPVDKNGKHLMDAIMWQDLRTKDLCKEFEQEIKVDFYKKTGMNLSSILSVVKALWIKKYQPDIYKKTHKILGIHEYILKMITNKFITDQSIANRTGLFNVIDCKWDDELIDYFGVDKDKLCDIIPSGSICGNVSEEFSRLTGLPEGIPVISAGGDQQCALLGLNSNKPGSIVINTGTGSYIMGASDRPVWEENMATSCNVSAIKGQWIVESSLQTTGTIFRWFNSEFYCDISGCEGVYQRISKDIKESLVGSNGLILLPYFKGCSLPKWNPNATGMFFNVRLNTKRGDFARAILEGIGSEIKSGVDAVSKIVGNFERACISGGLTQLEEFNQIQADMLKKDIIRYSNCESTAFGAWISATQTLKVYRTVDEAFSKVFNIEDAKVYKPLKENFEIYDDYHKMKMELKNALYKNT